MCAVLIANVKYKSWGCLFIKQNPSLQWSKIKDSGLLNKLYISNGWKEKPCPCPVDTKALRTSVTKAFASVIKI